MAAILSLQLTWGLPKRLKICSQVVRNSETFTGTMARVKILALNRETFSTNDSTNQNYVAKMMLQK